MLNFAVGPVQMDEQILQLGAEQIPYFRTDEFSELMKQNENWLKQCTGAEEDSRVLFLTGSGTAAMEAAVQNVFNRQDKLLVVNGGSFGKRFAAICSVHHFQYTEIILRTGYDLTEEDLYAFNGLGYTGVLINVLETSSGVHYNLDLVSRFCKDNHCLLIVDAISSFLADPLYMEQQNIDVLLAGSQKALALPPGISILVLNKHALSRVNQNQIESLYFDLKQYLKDGERGQTPFTPAVSILIQLHKRLEQLIKRGIEAEQQRMKDLAIHFREGIKDLPFTIPSNSLSNAVTPLHPLNVSAYTVFTTLKNEYGIFVCPNGGELADSLFRVGHMGSLTKEDNQRLLDALYDMKERGLL